MDDECANLRRKHNLAPIPPLVCGDCPASPECGINGIVETPDLPDPEAWVHYLK